MTLKERQALRDVRLALQSIQDSLLIIQRVAEDCEHCGCANLICEADGLLEGTIEAISDLIWE